MGIDTEGVGSLLVILFAVVLVGCLIFFGIPAIQNERDARTDRLNAEANLQQAKADTERARGDAEAMVINARSNLEHQREVDWQHTFMLYTATLGIYLGSNSTALVIVSVVLGVLVATVVILTGNRLLNRFHL